MVTGYVDVVVEVHPHGLPLGEDVGTGRQGAQRRFGAPGNGPASASRRRARDFPVRRRGCGPRPDANRCW